MTYLFLFVLLWTFLNRARHPKHPLQLNIYFGVPGSGKTTYAAYLAKQAQRESIIIRLCRRFPCRFTHWILSGSNWKRAYPVWSNVPIQGTYQLNAKSDIGVYMIQDGKMIIDEAGVEFNNRDYKAFPKSAIRFFKYHRCSMQSPHRIFTARVARTLCPHLGHTSFRVLDFFGFSGSAPALFPALLPPLAGGVQPVPRLMYISPHPCRMM